MNNFDIINHVINPGFSLLPPALISTPAKAMLIAIGLQESRFISRMQIGGPARSYFQFESGGGVKGVLSHQYTKPIIEAILQRLDIPDDRVEIFEAMAWNDSLATVFARLLLWTVPEDLPGEGEHDESWRQYVTTWRPGKPRRDSWNVFYDQAWSTVL